MRIWISAGMFNLSLIIEVISMLIHLNLIPVVVTRRILILWVIKRCYQISHQNEMCNDSWNTVRLIIKEEYDIPKYIILSVGLKISKLYHSSPRILFILRETC